MESAESIIAETGYTAAGLSIEIRQGCAPAGRSPGNSQSAVERRELGGVRRLPTSCVSIGKRQSCREQLGRFLRRRRFQF